MCVSEIVGKRADLSVTLCFVCIDVHVLLMTDILVFMQEKDQKYIFPCLVSQCFLLADYQWIHLNSSYIKIKLPRLEK